jgi:hypothetical protein
MVTEGTERRRNPRLEVTQDMHVESGSHEVAVTVLNASRDGLLLQASVPYLAGDVDAFRFVARDGNSIMLDARVMRTMTVTTGPACSYLIGLEFMDRGNPQVDQAIEHILSTYAAGAA